MNFIELKIKDANQLLEEAHDYIRWRAPLDIKGMSQNDKFMVCCEAMRVTVRLTRILAWLMLQQAILDGELTREDCFLDDSSLLEDRQCLEDSSENDVEVPRSLREILKRSRNLYEQTMRLETFSLREPPLPEEIKKGKTTVVSGQPNDL